MESGRASLVNVVGLYSSLCILVFLCKQWYGVYSSQGFFSLDICRLLWCIKQFIADLHQFTPGRRILAISSCSGSCVQGFFCICYLLTGCFLLQLFYALLFIVLSAPLHSLPFTRELLHIFSLPVSW